jgi:hypothetical protein
MSKSLPDGITFDWWRMPLVTIPEDALIETSEPVGDAPLGPVLRELYPAFVVPADVDTQTPWPAIKRPDR